MTEHHRPDTFEDINEAVGAEWETETTPAERVKTILSQQYEPIAADAVASKARVSPKTARKHCESLAADGYARTEPGSNGATTYARSPESLVVEQAASILEEYTTTELTARIEEMREELREFQDTYGVDDPEELAVKQAHETLATESETSSQITPEDRTAWQTTRRNLAFATAALSIANAEQFVDDVGRNSN